MEKTFNLEPTDKEKVVEQLSTLLEKISHEGYCPYDESVYNLCDLLIAYEGIDMLRKDISLSAIQRLQARLQTQAADIDVDVDADDTEDGSPIEKECKCPYEEKERQMVEHLSAIGDILGIPYIGGCIGKDGVMIKSNLLKRFGSL